MDGNVPFTLAEYTGIKNKYPKNNHTLEVLWVSTCNVQTGKTWNLSACFLTNKKILLDLPGQVEKRLEQPGTVEGTPARISLEFWDLRAEKSRHVSLWRNITIISFLPFLCSSGGAEQERSHSRVGPAALGRAEILAGSSSPPRAEPAAGRSPSMDLCSFHGFVLPAPVPCRVLFARMAERSSELLVQSVAFPGVSVQG